MSTPAGVAELTADHEVLGGPALDELLVGARIAGVVLDGDVDTLRLRRDGGRWELAVHVFDVVRFGVVAASERSGDELHLVDEHGARLLTVANQPAPVRSFDLGRWTGRRSGLDGSDDPTARLASRLLDRPAVTIHLGLAHDDELASHVVVSAGHEAVQVEGSDTDSPDPTLEIEAFDARDLTMRVLELGGLLDPYGLDATVDLLITAPQGEGRSRVTVLEWTGEGGRLTTPDEDGAPVEADPAQLIGEIAEALAPYCAPESEPVSA